MVKLRELEFCLSGNSEGAVLGSQIAPCIDFFSRSKESLLPFHYHKKEIAALDAENTASSRMLELRKNQFALLLHVVDELQNTIEEEQKSLIEEKEHKHGMEDASGGSEPMHVD